MAKTRDLYSLTDLRPEVQSQGVSRAGHLSLAFLASSSFWWLLTFLGIPWLVAASNLRLCLHVAFFLCVWYSVETPSASLF